MSKNRRKSFIVGLTWRRLSEDNNENCERCNDEQSRKPLTRSRSRLSSGLGFLNARQNHPHKRLDESDEENIPDKICVNNNKSSEIFVPSLNNVSSCSNKSDVTNRSTRRSLRRIPSMRDTLGSFKNKMRTSTRKKKRLVNCSPSITPVQNTSLRGIRHTSITPSPRCSTRKMIKDTKMYSPFSIDTPSKTPIRMGLREPKRFNFSSPGQLHRDINSVLDGIRHLDNINNGLNSLETTLDKQQYGAFPKMGTTTKSSQKRRRTICTTTSMSGDCAANTTTQKTIFV